MTSEAPRPSSDELAAQIEAFLKAGKAITVLESPQPVPLRPPRVEPPPSGPKPFVRRRQPPVVLDYAELDEPDEDEAPAPPPKPKPKPKTPRKRKPAARKPKVQVPPPAESLLAPPVLEPITLSDGDALSAQAVVVAILKAAGMTQLGLAELSGLHPNMVGYVARGEKSTSWGNVVRLIQAGGYSLRLVPTAPEKPTSTGDYLGRMCIVRGDCGHVLAVCWVDENEADAEAFAARHRQAGHRVETVARYSGDPFPTWCPPTCQRHTAPIDSEGGHCD